MPAVAAAGELGSVPGVNDLPGAGGCSQLWGGRGVAVGLRRDPGAFPEQHPRFEAPWKFRADGHERAPRR